MSTKSRSFGNEVYTKTHWRHGIDTPWYYTETRQSGLGGETISGTSRGRGFTNHVAHLKRNDKFGLGTFTGVSAPNGNFVATYVNETWAPAISPTFPSGFISPSLNDFKRRFVGSGSANLLTFLAELTDVSELLTSAQRIISGVSSFGDAWLSYNLGLTPFLSDIKSLYSTFSTMEEKLKRLKDLNNKVVKVRFRETLSGKHASEEVAYNFCKHRVYTTYSTVMRASCRAKLSLPQSFNFSFLDEFALRSEILGLELTAANFWELIPFSFVVDYFLPLGNIVDDLSSTYLDSSIQLWDFCQSNKTTFRCEAVITYDGMLGGVLNGHVARSSEGKQYVRQPYLAGTYQTISLRDLSIPQAVTIAALASSRR